MAFVFTCGCPSVLVSASVQRTRLVFLLNLRELECFIISMMVMCNATVITGHDKRRLGLPNAPLDKRYDNHDT